MDVLGIQRYFPVFSTKMVLISGLLVRGITERRKKRFFVVSVSHSQILISVGIFLAAFDGDLGPQIWNVYLH